MNFLFVVIIWDNRFQILVIGYSQSLCIVGTPEGGLGFQEGFCFIRKLDCCSGSELEHFLWTRHVAKEKRPNFPTFRFILDSRCYFFLRLCLVGELDNAKATGEGTSAQS